MSYMDDQKIKKLITKAGYDPKKSHFKKILKICQQVRDFRNTYEFGGIEWYRDEDTDIEHHAYSCDEYQGFTLYLDDHMSDFGEWSVSAWSNDDSNIEFYVGEEDETSGNMPISGHAEDAIKIMKDKITTYIMEREILESA